MRDHVPSSPRFLRLVGRALLAGTAALAIAAVFVPAPLGPAADPAHAPNPARSAWFLLWIQELVSHGTGTMAAVVLLFAGFVALPWLRRSRAMRAAWFAPGERGVGVAVLLLAAGILALTIVAAAFRGAQWQLVSPF